ncbi:MAG: hypothetical protein E7226_04550 [Clostridiales bacterium]|nr:hypothetical protein [Clostridiales bacterium]
MKRKTHKEFVAEMAAKHPDIEVVGIYTRSTDPVACRCRKCGHEWSPAAGSLSAGQGCPGCKALNTSKRLRKTHEEFIAEMAAKHPDIEVVGTYARANDPVACRCRKCGYEWSPKATILLRGRGCPKCARKR